MQADKRALIQCTLLLAAATADCSSGGTPAAASASSTSATGDSRSIDGAVVGTLPGVGTLGGCIGTLITPYKVLTAAHCINSHHPDEFQFVIGQDVSHPLYTLPVVSLDIAPGFDADLDNDIGIATLGVAAPVPTVPLISAIDSTWAGKDLVFVGFGDSNGLSRAGSGVERDVSIPIATVQPKIITFGGGPDNICFGDSGGPGFYQDADGNLLLVSVTSYTTQANCAGTSGATRIDAYLDFIGEPSQAPTSTTSVSTSSTGSTTGATGASTGNSGCGNETAAGRCNGDTVIWCSNNQVEQQDCAAVDGHCSWSYLNQIYGCASGAAPAADPCAGETFEGRCDDNVSIWCYDQTTIIRDNCSSANKVCGWNAQLGYNDCLPGQ